MAAFWNFCKKVFEKKLKFRYVPTSQKISKYKSTIVISTFRIDITPGPSKLEKVVDRFQIWLHLHNFSSSFLFQIYNLGLNNVNFENNDILFYLFFDLNHQRTSQDCTEVGRAPLIIFHFSFLWPGLRIGILLDNWKALELDLKSFKC